MNFHKSLCIFLLTVVFLLARIDLVSGILHPDDLEAWNDFLEALEPNGNPWYFKNCKCRAENTDGCNTDGTGSPCGCRVANGIYRILCESFGEFERIVAIVLPQNRLFGDFPRDSIQRMTELRLLNVSSTEEVTRESNVFLDAPLEGCYTLDECFGSQLTCDFRNSFESGISLCTPSSRSPTFSPTNSPTDPPTLNPTRSPTISPTEEPTAQPTDHPTSNPTHPPTSRPSASPTLEPTNAPTDTPTTPEPTTQAPTVTMPTFFPTGSKPTPFPTPIPPNPSVTPSAALTPSLPTSSPTNRPGILNPIEQAAWQILFDSLRGQDWRPCVVDRFNPCAAVCEGSNGISCALSGRRRLQGTTTDLLSLTGIQLSQNNVKGVINHSVIVNFPRLGVLEFQSQPGSENANFLQGNGPGNCLYLPMCFEPQLRCDFEGSGASLCDEDITLSPTRSPSSTPAPISSAEARLDPLLISGISLLVLLVLLVWFICCCICIRMYYPEYLPERVNRAFDTYYGKEDSKSEVASVPHSSPPIEEDRDLKLNLITDGASSEASSQSDMLAKNPDLQKAKQEALDVDRVVSKNIHTVEDLLRHAKMPQYTEVFDKQGMDLQALLIAGNDQLKSLGIPLGDRVKLLRVTKLIRELPE